jgi:hypothetical protein
MQTHGHPGPPNVLPAFRDCDTEGRRDDRASRNLCLVCGMMALFIWNRLRYDLVALLELLVAMASGIVPPEKAFLDSPTKW